MDIQRFRNFAKEWWRGLILVGAPLLLLPLPLKHDSQAGLCAYVILVVAAYWVSEVLPLAVTALMPVVLFPVLGVMPANKVAINYFKDINFMLVGGLLIAMCIEKWHLHMRIALRVLMLVGSKPQWIMFGFMITTAFLSMWLSNTATTAMMMPIAHAVILALEDNRRRNQSTKQNGDCEEDAAAILKEGGACVFNQAEYHHNDNGKNQQERRAIKDAQLKRPADREQEMCTIEDANFNTMGHVDILPHGRSRHLSNGSAHASDSARPTGPAAHASVLINEETKEAKYNSCPLLNTAYDDGIAEKEQAKEQRAVRKDTASSEEGEVQRVTKRLNTDTHRIREDRDFARMCTGLRLCIAYAANIGGSGTLTGSPPQLVLKGILDQIYGEQNGLGFSSWMAFAFPNMLITLFCAWIWLQLMFIGTKAFTSCTKKGGNNTDNNASAVIRQEYSKLGSISFAEKAVLGHFLVLVALWLSKEPAKGVANGWASLSFIKQGYVTDATVVMAVSLCLFLFPSQPLWSLPSWFCRRPSWLCFGRRQKGSVTEDTCDLSTASRAAASSTHDRHRHTSGTSRVTWKDTESAITELTVDDPDPHRRPGPPPLLEWKYATQHMSWGILFIFGGGMALADACKGSGLSANIGEYLTRFGAWPTWGLVLLLSTVTALLTEVTSNTATATIFLPIIVELSASIGVNPLYLTIPTALSCSFAFMLPIATPPNAIVFGYGGLTIRDMVKAGIVMNVISIAVLQFSMHTYTRVYFGLDQYPSWAMTSLPAAITVSHNASTVLPP